MKIFFRRNRTWLIALVGAACVTLLCFLGGLGRVDQWSQDVHYQQPGPVSGDVIVIGIDDYALEELGPYQDWDRNIMAAALEALASDPENLPAVVGVDTLYVGETDPEADANLARAAASLPRVVSASAALIGQTAELTADRTVRTDDFAVLNYEEPYRALREVTAQGHVNVVYDTDGVLRHAIHYLQLPDGRKVRSFAYETAKLYAESQGLPLYEPPTDSRGRFFLPYTAGPGAFYDGFSIADLINGAVPPDYYADRIVLIGPYAAGLQDAVITPVDRAAQMYGVEFHANVIEALLHGGFKQEVPERLQAALLFLVSFASMALFDRLSFRWSTLLCAAVTLGARVGAAALYRAGWLMHPLWIPVSVFLLYIVSVAVRYAKSVLEKQRVTRTFSRYVDPEIVQELLREGTDAMALGGKLCNIAVLFVDIRGFTTMSERLDPVKVVKILNRFLEMTCRCIAENHGTLDKFVGDCTMAFWGAPVRQEDSAYLAAKTALEIIAGADVLSAELKEELGEELHCGVGVNYGPAVVGNIGAERRMDYTAIGDTVNTAARLESNAPGGKVLISRAVADALGPRCRTTSLGGSIKLKGKAEGFEVLTLDELL